MGNLFGGGGGEKPPAPTVTRMPVPNAPNTQSAQRVARSNSGGSRQSRRSTMLSDAFRSVSRSMGNMGR